MSSLYLVATSDKAPKGTTLGGTNFMNLHVTFGSYPNNFESTDIEMYYGKKTKELKVKVAGRTIYKKKA